MNRTVPDVLVCLILALTTLVVYWPVTGHDFVNFDDDAYVTENRQVQRGFTAESIAWCLTAEVSGNWHPLTLASHMMDVELDGMDPGRHHRSSLLLHVVNTLLLFLILRRMTRALWPSALVAALFALHPLHVESVAWVSERKDVLSTSFWILTIGSYAWYVERPGLGRYLPTLMLFALGLMAKPMLVTLPFVLLLLDYWPLERWRPGESGLGRLVLEKVPLFILAAASSVVTYSVQQAAGAVRLSSVFPLSFRVSNAVVSYVTYLGKTIWPTGLAVLYPYPTAIAWWKVAAAGLCLVLVNWLVIRGMKRRPYVVVGWLWYVGTLVPVIGLVQVGVQSMADRYTYVPLIGIFVVIAWALTDLAGARRQRVMGFAVAVVATLVLLSVITRQQVRHWSDSVALFEHTLRVTADNYTAHNNLGLALVDEGREEEAIEHFSEAVRINPGYARAHNNLGAALRRAGRLDDAIRHFERALDLDPGNAKVHNNLANCLVTQGRTEEAIPHYFEAVRIDPGYVLAHYNLAINLRKVGRTDDAIRHYTEALRIDPGFARAHNNLGVILRGRGDIEQAIHHFEEALRIDPDYEKARKNLEKAKRGEV